MKTVTMKEKNDTMTIKIGAIEAPKGHQSHRSGAGKHHDRRTNRQRTRSNKNRAALTGW